LAIVATAWLLVTYETLLYASQFAASTKVGHGMIEGQLSMWGPVLKLVCAPM